MIETISFEGQSKINDLTGSKPFEWTNSICRQLITGHMNLEMWIYINLGGWMRFTKYKSIVI